MQLKGVRGPCLQTSFIRQYLMRLFVLVVGGPHCMEATLLCQAGTAPAARRSRLALNLPVRRKIPLSYLQEWHTGCCVAVALLALVPFLRDTAMNLHIHSFECKVLKISRLDMHALCIKVGPLARQAQSE